MEQQNKDAVVIREFQKKIMTEAGCGVETMAFLDEITDAVFCEYYYLCALDGMSVEEMREIDSVPIQDWKEKINLIKEKRLNYLEKLFVPNSQMERQIAELHEKAEKVFGETEELKNTLNSTLTETLKMQKEALSAQKQSFQNVITAKEEIIKERDRKIQDLLTELEGNKIAWQEEKQSLLLKLEEQKQSEHSQEGKEEEGLQNINKRKEKQPEKKFWHFFRKDRAREDDQFIKTFLDGDKYNDAQKEFLIHCLEEGDSVEEMKTYASPDLMPTMMERLRKVRKNRGE